jgi:hypothetical protein
MKNRELHLNTILLKLGIKKSELVPVSVDQPTGIPIGSPKWIGRENRNVFGVAHTAITTKFIYSLKMDDRIQIAIMKEEGWVEGTKKLEVVDRVRELSINQQITAIHSPPALFVSYWLYDKLVFH